MPDDQRSSRADITTRNRAIKKLLEQLWGRGKARVFSGRDKHHDLHIDIDHPDADTGYGQARLARVARREIRRGGIKLPIDSLGEDWVWFTYWKDGVQMFPGNQDELDAAITFDDEESGERAAT